MPTDTKTRILAAATELYRRQGMTGTGLKQIAELAKARAAEADIIITNHALLAINAYEGWASNPVDAIVDGTGRLLDVPASQVLDPFSPRFRSPFDDVVDIVAGILTLWVVDAVFGALSRQAREPQQSRPGSWR